MTSARPGRRLAPAVTAVVLAALALGLGPVASPAPVLAAPPDLTLVTATTYQVLPEEGRIAIMAQVTATNHLVNTTTRRYYFEQAFLGVLPGTTNFAITTPGGSPTVAVTDRTAEGVLLRIRFGERLEAGASMTMTLTFDLVDPGGAPDRLLRVSPSLVSFQAWAYGTPETPGSSVQVLVPDGYTVTLGRGPLLGPTTAEGWQRYTSGPLDAPLTFVADVAADRPADLVEGTRSTTVGGQTVLLRLRAWPDDPGWRDRVADLFLRGLPVMGQAIGAPWPFEEPITIQETLVRGSGGYAGVFEPAEGLVHVSYTAEPGVVLHEAAHGWFNGALVADRWMAEAFASYYAELAATALEVPIASPDLAALPPDGPVFPLNAWPATGVAETGEDLYGYAASLALAREIATVVGDESLRATWAAAAAGEPAYQPGGGAGGVGGANLPETGVPPPDWRAFLDLLQAHADPGAADDLERLWRRWVLRPEDQPLLIARAEARLAYDALVADAQPWLLPRTVRDAMRAWQFEAAHGLMDQARSVLRQRAAIEAAASELGLTPAPTLRAAFEGDVGLAAAGAEAATELATLARIAEAEAEGSRMANPSLLDRIGLIGVDPEARLAAARAGYEVGDQDQALAEASAAQAIWELAPGVARGRIISGLGLLVALIVLGVLARQQQRRRRRIAERRARSAGSRPAR